MAKAVLFVVATALASFGEAFYLDRSHNGNDWSQVRERYRAEINSGKMNQRQATKEMLNLLGDKYTRLISAQVYESLSKYDMLGAGVMLSPNSEGRLSVAALPMAVLAEGRLSVAAPPMAASAAEKRGIVKGDLVTAINGMPTATMTSFDVIEFLSKYQEPTITFTITKPDGGSERVVELQRSFQKVSDPVGYMRIKEFNAVVVDKVREALVDLQAQGADEYILDLRGNGGGAFQSALGIASLFMENAPITYVVDGDGKKVGFNTKTDAVNTSAPLVVWIDRKSARRGASGIYSSTELHAGLCGPAHSLDLMRPVICSAFEVLAGALHDDCRALLMGTRSFGKGLIQAVYGLSDGSGLIVTVARYETPRGTNIQIGKAIDQGSFDIARERQLTCPPFE
ncbi:ClpP/crotonase-like domain-containing protein [Tribonema minus]|uniref:ClpP/crotonase-like domain-containing protein n=1 Tax=Tribonema minus TaxID=303371 RepID=A0A835YMM1_9STRA|nr:ClpP/crotonase-like domain-containing protein [Tribonema minus]